MRRYNRLSHAEATRTCVDITACRVLRQHRTRVDNRHASPRAIFGDKRTTRERGLFRLGIFCSEHNDSLGKGDRTNVKKASYAVNNCSKLL